MLNEKDYCNYETCVALKELGYNCSSDYTYVNNYRVRDEIYEKHPGLSDDGYLDLIDEYGGPYKRDEVFGNYLEPLKTWSRNSMLDEPFEVCSCIHLYDAQKWFRKEFKILIVPRYRELMEMWDCIIYDENKINIYATSTFKQYEESLLEGIKKAIDINK